MAFCIQCGSQLEDGQKFCPNCGTAQIHEQTAQQSADQSGANEGDTQTGTYNAGQAYSGQTDPNPGYQNTDPQQDIEANKGVSILCYFGILLLIPLLTQPNSPFVKFHSNQGLVLLLLWVALAIVNVIPILGQIVSVIGYVFSIVCFVMGIVNVCNGETKELPLIGSIKILN